VGLTLTPNSVEACAAEATGSEPSGASDTPDTSEPSPSPSTAATEQPDRMARHANRKGTLDFIESPLSAWSLALRARTIPRSLWLRKRGVDGNGPRNAGAAPSLRHLRPMAGTFARRPARRRTCGCVARAAHSLQVPITKST